MTEEKISDLSGFAGMLENWMATQKRFAPSGRVMAEFAEAVRTISQAQLTYGQTVMRANAALLSAIWETAAVPGLHKPEMAGSPSKAAQQPNAKAS